jgi:hypothetical protein
MQQRAHELFADVSPAPLGVEERASIDDGEIVAPELYHLACDATRRRKAQTERRLAWLESRWNDESYFGAVFASGRYLKFCNVLEWAFANDEQALRRLEYEVLLAQGKLPG